MPNNNNNRVHPLLVDLKYFWDGKSRFYLALPKAPINLRGASIEVFAKRAGTEQVHLASIALPNRPSAEQIILPRFCRAVGIYISKEGKLDPHGNIVLGDEEVQTLAQAETESIFPEEDDKPPPSAAAANGGAPPPAQQSWESGYWTQSALAPFSGSLNLRSNQPGDLTDEILLEAKKNNILLIQPYRRVTDNNGHPVVSLPQAAFKPQAAPKISISSLSHRHPPPRQAAVAEAESEVGCTPRLLIDGSRIDSVSEFNTILENLRLVHVSAQCLRLRRLSGLKPGEEMDIPFGKVDIDESWLDNSDTKTDGNNNTGLFGTPIAVNTRFQNEIGDSLCNAGGYLGDIDPNKEEAPDTLGAFRALQKDNKVEIWFTEATLGDEIGIIRRAHIDIDGFSPGYEAWRVGLRNCDVLPTLASETARRFYEIADIYPPPAGSNSDGDQVDSAHEDQFRSAFRPQQSANPMDSDATGNDEELDDDPVLNAAIRGVGATSPQKPSNAARIPPSEWTCIAVRFAQHFDIPHDEGSQPETRSAGEQVSFWLAVQKIQELRNLRQDSAGSWSERLKRLRVRAGPCGVAVGQLDQCLKVIDAFNPDDYAAAALGDGELQNYIKARKQGDSLDLKKIKHLSEAINSVTGEANKITDGWSKRSGNAKELDRTPADHLVRQIDNILQYDQNADNEICLQIKKLGNWKNAGYALLISFRQALLDSRAYDPTAAIAGKFLKDFARVLAQEEPSDSIITKLMQWQGRPESKNAVDALAKLRQSRRVDAISSMASTELPPQDAEPLIPFLLASDAYDSLEANLGNFDPQSQRNLQRALYLWPLNASNTWAKFGDHNVRRPTT